MRARARSARAAAGRRRGCRAARAAWLQQADVVEGLRRRGRALCTGERPPPPSGEMRPLSTVSHTETGMLVAPGQPLRHQGDALPDREARQRTAEEADPPVVVRPGARASRARGSSCRCRWDRAVRRTRRRGSLRSTSSSTCSPSNSTHSRSTPMTSSVVGVVVRADGRGSCAALSGTRVARLSAMIDDVVAVEPCASPSSGSSTAVVRAGLVGDGLGDLGVDEGLVVDGRDALGADEVGDLLHPGRARLGLGRQSGDADLGEVVGRPRGSRTPRG